MSGIVGIWNMDGRPVDDALLARLSDAMAHRGPDGEGRWIHGAVGLACRLFRVTPESVHETQPLVDPTGTALVFDGRLDNRDELLACLQGSHEVSRETSDPALLLAAYEAFGARLPERLVGDFAFALFDPRQPQLLLARDALGVRPLCYCRLKETFLFASEAKAILGHPAVSSKPNEELLADFLLDGACDPELTFFTGILNVLPAHRIVLTPDGFATQRYWDFDPEHRIRLGSFEAYATAFRDVFEQAVRRRLRSRTPVVVSVSGGLDSSSILCAAYTLARRGQAPTPDVHGMSYVSPPESPSNEQAFLADIEQAYQRPIHRVSVEPREFLERSRDGVWHVEAPILDEQWGMWRQFQATANQHIGARVVLTGLWGDQVLCPLGYLVDLFRHLRWTQVWRHLDALPRWRLDTHPQYWMNRLVRDVVKYHLPSSIVRWLRSLRQRKTPSRPWFSQALHRRLAQHQRKKHLIGQPFRTLHARSLYREVRSGHHVLGMEWENKAAAMAGLDMRFPFLDRDLIAFLMAIPGDIQTHQGIPKALLREAMRGILPPAIAAQRANADPVPPDDHVGDLYPELIRCVDSGSRAIGRGYVNRPVIERHLEPLRRGLAASSAESVGALSDLLGLELWLRRWFGET